jgi:hypothetical protein
VAVDGAATGTMTEVMFTTLFGELFRLNAATGANIDSPNPLFSFTTDLKPFGSAPALFSTGNLVYAVAASGGYLDYDTDTEPLWTSSSTMQQAVAVAVKSPSGNLNETTTLAIDGLKFVYNLGTGQLSYSQAQIIGDNIFLTTDSTDVNATSYGTGGNTGNMHKLTLGGTIVGTTVAIMGGAASIGHSGTTTYAATGDKAQQLSVGAGSDTPTQGVNGGSQSKVARRLWLRTL